MKVQAYCMVNPENVCDNVCVWDGNTNTWQPPTGYTMLVQETTPAMVWGWDGSDFVLVEEIGQGQIGFTWDGNALITNQPLPKSISELSNQPTSTGTQTL